MNDIKMAKPDPAVAAGMDYQVLAKKMEYLAKPKQSYEKQSEPAASSSKSVDKTQEPDPEALVEDLKDFAARNNISLSFEVDKATGRTVIKIMDKETDRVLRQLPPEELLDLAASLDDWAGHFLNARA